jgi:predicted transcriptional regulator of viral defense system
VPYEPSRGSNERKAPPDVALARIAARQHGLVTLAQLQALGLDPPAVSNRVKTGRLHRTHRGVYAVGHRALPQAGVWRAAVLACGPGAALSHLSAATLWQIWRRRATGTVVSVPRQRRPRNGIRLHCCRRLDPRDVTRRDGIPVTTVPRTLVDLADVLTPEQLANVIHEAAFRNRFDLAATRAAMARANGRRNLAALERALALNAQGSAGTKSTLEDRFLDLIRATGHPDPLPNAGVQTRSGRIEVDFFWPDRRLCVEIDGPGHTRERTRTEDRERDEALLEAGHEVVRFTGEAGPDEVLAGLGSLEQEGWRKRKAASPSRRLPSRRPRPSRPR